MEHAGAVVLHLGLLEVEVCLVWSNDRVAVPHRVHPDWWPENINLDGPSIRGAGNGGVDDDNDNEDGNHGTSQGKPPQELPPSWRHFSLEEQLGLEEVGGLRQPLWQQLESNLGCSSFGSTVHSCTMFAYTI